MVCYTNNNQYKKEPEQLVIIITGPADNAGMKHSLNLGYLISAKAIRDYGLLCDGFKCALSS